MSDAKWQPIETAPKDGSSVDLWFAHDDEEWRVADCAWVSDAYQKRGAWVRLYDRAIIAPEGPPWVQPSHWIIVDPPA